MFSVWGSARLSLLTDPQPATDPCHQAAHARTLRRFAQWNSRPLHANMRSWAAGSPYAAFRREIEARNLTRARPLGPSPGQSGLEGRKGEVMESDSRKQRVSSTVNDRIYNALWGFGAEDGAFACECGRSSCAEEVVMTPRHICACATGARSSPHPDTTGRSRSRSRHRPRREHRQSVIGRPTRRR
jgi:hypothetical protein